MRSITVLLPLLLAALFLPVQAAEGKTERSLFEKETPVPLRTPLDQRFAESWRHASLAIPREASDAVQLRRVHLALAGRLPTPQEAEAYFRDTAPDKYEKMVDRLLNSPDFPAFWSMKWADVLRIKSEFPINLWPNAVYAYHRLLYRSLSKNEPLDRLFRHLLLATGSNFRDPEANFLRAAADRTPRGLSRNIALTLFGCRTEQWPEKDQQALEAFFSQIRYKKTWEWKEEIVFVQPETAPVSLTLPNGSAVTIQPGEDRRTALADYVFDPREQVFAAATVNRTWCWFFGHGLNGGSGDDLPRPGPDALPEPGKLLTQQFSEDGYDFRELCRRIVLSAPFRASALPRENLEPQHLEKAEHMFAQFPLRRLDAEVLDDMIGTLSGNPSSYSSVIPEPFSFIPKEERTVLLTDGSISSRFLGLFGRPSRDGGGLDERNNRISAEQRLYLFNSGELYRKMGRIPGVWKIRGRALPAQLDRVYLLFYSRYPSPEEKQLLRRAYPAEGKEKARFLQDLCWVLLNSKEFLYQH